MKTKLIVITFILTAFAITTFAQRKTNLQLINKLIEQSVAKADSSLGGKREIGLKVISTQPLEVIKAKIFQSFADRGYVLKSITEEMEVSIDYIFTSAKVEYKNSFSDGLFGGTAMERIVSLSGSFVITKKNKTILPVQFLESNTDTIKIDEIPSLEDQTAPFTHAEIPAQPLLSSFWEPIIVVGTLIVTVILLFTVRSK